MCSSLTLSYSHKQLMMIPDKISQLCVCACVRVCLCVFVYVCCVLCVVIVSSNASMLGCSFEQEPLIYYISSARHTLLGLSGKGHSCPTACMCCPQ